MTQRILCIFLFPLFFLSHIVSIGHHSSPSPFFFLQSRYLWTTLLRDWSLIRLREGGGGGSTKREGECEVYPYEKGGGGGGAEKVLAMLKGRQNKCFEVVLTP